MPILKIIDNLQACVHIQSIQSYPTLCDPMDCNPPRSLFMRFSRQEYWSGWPCPPPGDLPNPGIEPASPALQVDSLPTEPSGKPKSLYILAEIYIYIVDTR